MTAGVSGELGDAASSLAQMSTGGPVDFDATVFILVALFLILMTYFNVVLFRPYLRARDTRRERIAGAKKSARLMEERADEIFSQYEDRLTQALGEGDAERKRIRQIARGEEREILAEAHRQMEEMLRQARANLGVELDKAAAELNRQAQEISESIVEKVLAP